MCGIVGIVSSSEPISTERLTVARDVIDHRGPDDSGLWFSEDHWVGLAHRRLSIIDLRPEGRQPMTDTRNRAWITFNGEIYNYRELREELERRGECFRTRTDTEVLLIAYLVWGLDCVKRFNGMWSFAIWDTEKSMLFLSRDRAGKKPLYYAQDNERFAFASQLKALRCFREFPWEVNVQALNAYLTLGYIPAQLCIFSPAKKLPPGHSAIYDLRSKTLKVWRYWDIPEQLPNSIVNGRNYLLDKFEALATKSVAMRLEADVPVGVLLSGGVDSSIIAALATKIKGKGQVKTFNIKMPDPKMDESQHARKVANYLGTDHYELQAEPSSLDLLPELAEFFDEPLADSSLIPTYVLSRLTREHVTVALGGDGGDELFGGYGHYLRPLNWHHRLKRVPKSAWAGVSFVSERLFPVGSKGRNLLVSLKKGPAEMMVYGTPFFNPYDRRRLLSPKVKNRLNGDFLEPEQYLISLRGDRSSLLEQNLKQDFQSYLPDDILVKVDRASMGVALEVRAPLLDVNVIEFAYSEVPDHWKILNGNRRKLEVALADKLLPGQLDTRRKQGFSIPLFEWFREDAAEKKIKQWIWDTPLRDYINLDKVEDLIKGVKIGRRNQERLFALCMLGLAIGDM